MRISDWSSDVCSSDLPRRDGDDFVGDLRAAAGTQWHRRHLAAGAGGGRNFAAGAAGIGVAWAEPARPRDAPVLALDLFIARGSSAAGSLRRHVRHQHVVTVKFADAHYGAAATYCNESVD